MPDTIAFAFSKTALAIIAIGFFALLLVGGKLIAPHNQLSCRDSAPLPLQALQSLPVFGKATILRVELARNRLDLEQVFEPRGLEPRLVLCNVRDARLGNTLDTWLFIPSYTGLLICIGLILAQGDKRWCAMLVLVAILAAPLAAICDWTENIGITKVLNKIENRKPLLDSDATRISMPSLIKWTLTTLILLFYGVAATRQVFWHNWPVGPIAILGLAGGFLLAQMLFRYFLAHNSP